MSSPSWWTQVASDTAGGLLGAYIGDVVVAPASLQTRFITLAAAGTMGAAVTQYAQTQIETKKDDLSWALANPVTFVGLTAAYGSTYNVLLDLLVPEELLLVGPRLTAATAFALGGYTSLVTGPTVGTIAQLTVYLTMKMFNQPWPEPTIVVDSPGASHIGDFLWDAVKDFWKLAWAKYKTIKHDFDHSIQNGTLYPAYLVMALWDILTLVPSYVAESFGMVMWHFVKIVAAIIHSAKHVG